MAKTPAATPARAGTATTSSSKVKAATKTGIYQKSADATNLSKKDVRTFEELVKLIKNELGKKGPGVITLPGLLKLKRHEKKASKARQGRNPQTGDPITIAAKPKRTVVRALPLKSLHEMAASRAMITGGAPEHLQNSSVSEE